MGVKMISSHVATFKRRLFNNITRIQELYGEWKSLQDKLFDLLCELSTLNTQEYFSPLILDLLKTKTYFP